MSAQGNPSPAYQLLLPLTRAQAATAQSDISTAISGLNELVKGASSPDGESVDDIVWDVWNTVFDIAAEVPLQRPDDGLADFLTHLRKTTVVGSDGAAIKADDGSVWDELPQLGWVARDIWNFSPNDPDATEEKQVKFNNQTAFLARLTARANPTADPKDPFDYSSYALWSMRDAFEEAPPQGQPQKKPAVKNAAVWLRHAGKVLRDLSLAGYALDGNSGDPGALCLEKGWKGFSQDRWAVWKSGFEAAQGDQEIDAETRELIETGLSLL